MSKTNKFKVKSIENQDFVIHTEYFGKTINPVVLLISGAMAPARFWTDEFCLGLVDGGYFVIRFDNRDIGQSSDVWNKKQYSLNDLAHDAIVILDGYGINRAHAVGHSMGGYICQRLAIDYPNRISSMTIISAGPIGATLETDHPYTKKEKAILEQTWSVFLKPRDESTLEKQIQGFMPVWHHLNGVVPFDHEMAERYTRDLLTRTTHSICAGNPHELVMRGLNIDEDRGILSKITVPTLVIHGQRDPAGLLREGQAVANAIPNAQLKIINGMGHMIFNKQLELDLVKIIAQFISAH